MPTLAVLTFVSMPFREDIRLVLQTLFGVVLEDRWFDLLLAVGVTGLAALLVLTTNRATRTCENLTGQIQDAMADHRSRWQKDLAKHQKQLQQDVSASLDPKFTGLTLEIATLRSHVIALGSRLDALGSRLDALDTKLTAYKEKLLARSTDTT